MITAIHLTQSGVPCSLIEKGSYPFHRVCGEYISNEVVRYLRSLGAFPEELHPALIQQFQLTSVNGKTATLPLDLGGFGISRYRFDLFLFQKASQLGVEFFLDTEVEKVSFEDGVFNIQTNHEVHDASLVIGSFGKRSRLDVQLKRAFI